MTMRGRARKRETKPQNERPLTAQQRLFAEAVAKGASQAEAYRMAYNVRGKSENAIFSAASRLARNVKVSAYIQELLDEVKGQAVADLQELLEYLTAIVRTPIGEVVPSSPLCQSYEANETREKITMPSKLAAVQELCRLQGFYPADKMQLSGAQGEQLIPAHDLSDAVTLASVAEAVAVARARIEARS